MIAHLSKAQTYVSWTLQLVAAGILLQTLFFKFTAAEEVYLHLHYPRPRAVAPDRIGSMARSAQVGRVTSSGRRHRSSGRAHVPATRILILGGGFGGVHAAMRLERLFRGNDAIDVTLVSRDNSFLFTPMLHEVGCCTRSLPATSTSPIVSRPPQIVLLDCRQSQQNCGNSNAVSHHATAAVHPAATSDAPTLSQGRWIYVIGKRHAAVPAVHAASHALRSSNSQARTE